MASGDRLIVLDLARSAAIAGMLVYHLAYDLQIFGFLPSGTTTGQLWLWLARIVAGAFIFLAGISFWLTHENGFRLGHFRRRVLIIGCAAALVSVTSYAAFPGRFIHFGILHSIAVSSVLGAFVLRCPSWLIGLLAALVFVIGQHGASTMFDTPWLWWTGLSTGRPPSLDFEPVFPWFAAFLSGLAFAKLVNFREVFRTPVRSVSAAARIRYLTWPGRNSLLVYLVHQPVLIGCLALISRL